VMQHRTQAADVSGRSTQLQEVGSVGARLGGSATKATKVFAGLERDNSKGYWTANKAVFEEEVKEPMAALVDSLPERFQPFKGFRMNRDIRFSPDKSPYKTQHGAAHETGGTVYYLCVDACGLMVSCGAYMMAPDQLERYREAVDADATGRALEGILNDLSQRGIEVGHGMTEPLKTAPRGYPKDHPRVDLLRQKAVSAHRRLSGASLRDAEAVREFVVETFGACVALKGWGKR